MKSDTVKKGVDRAPHRSLLYATGLSKKDLNKPFIGIASSFADVVPGHTGMRDLERFIDFQISVRGQADFVPGKMSWGRTSNHVTVLVEPGPVTGAVKSGV